MFKYPPEIRTLIYTTNAIDNFNRQLRKVTKTKSAFVSDDALIHKYGSIDCGYRAGCWFL